MVIDHTKFQQINLINRSKSQQIISRNVSSRPQPKKQHILPSYVYS